MGLSLNRPASLDNGKLDITNGENPLLEWTGEIDSGLTNAYLYYFTDKDPVTGTRDSFEISIDSDNIDSNRNFIVEEDLTWHSSGDYELLHINTNLGSWNLLSDDEERTKTFIAQTGLDPAQASLQGFTLINNRSDRTYPQASLSVESIADGVLDVDAGEQFVVKGFLEDKRDDGLPGSGYPYIDLDWGESSGAHHVEGDSSDPDYKPENEFLSIHQPSFWNSPQWDSYDYGGGANAFGQVDVDDWNKDRFRWAMPGEWVVTQARLADKALNNYNDNTWSLSDGSASIYPRTDWRLQWDESQNSYQKTDYASYSQSHIDFKELHRLDLGDVEFTLVNSTPDITPPKVDSYAAGSSLDDGILDLSQGEKLSYQFKITDTAETNVASGFSNLWLTLRRSHSIDANGNKVEVTSPDGDSDYIRVYISNWDSNASAQGNTILVDRLIEDHAYIFKNDGYYVFDSLEIRDNAGNSYRHSKYNGDPGNKDQGFLDIAGIDVNSSAFNFRLINPNPDSTYPTISLNQSAQLSDNIVDIPAGEASNLIVSGNIIDLNNNGVAGSGLSHFSFTLENIATTKELYVHVNPQDLDQNGNFFKKIDLSNEAPGSFKVKYANFSDQANNSIWYSDDSGDADGQKLKFLNAGFDFDQWAFTLKNSDFDNTPPQGVISMPVQLEDGVLNISDGENALLNYQASFNDGTGSGFDYFSVELYNVDTDQTIYLGAGDYNLDDNGVFNIKVDASWASGTYQPKWASISDKAGNYASAYSNNGEALSSSQVVRFQQATGIDLSSTAFNFTILNDDADVSPPSIRDLELSSSSLTSVDGVKTLTIQPGADSTLSVSGRISDEPSGFESMWVQLVEKQSGATVSEWIDAYEINDQGDFKLDFDFSFMRSGDWTLGGFDIYDYAGNSVNYWKDLDGPTGSWEQQQIDQMFEIGIDVDDFNITVNNSNADFLVPLVDNVSLSFDEQTSQLIFKGDVSDDRSGFDYLWLRLEDKDSDQSLWVDVGDWNTQWAQGEEKTRLDGSFEVVQRLSNVASGTFEVTDAEIGDRAGNRISYWRWDNDNDEALQRLKNIGLDLNGFTFDLNNPNADLELPQFSGLSLNQTAVIDVAQSSELVISGNVSDGLNGSGFAGLQLILAHENGSEKIINLNPDSEGMSATGDFSTSIDFTYAASGQWSLKEAFLMDEAGNTASYFNGDWDAAEEAERFLDSGLDLSAFNFTVSNANLQDITLPTITFDSNKPQRVGNNVVLSGQVDDGATGSGLNEFYINLYNFTIKEWMQLELEPENVADDGSFAVSAPYEYLTNAEWRIENIYLSDKAGNYANYWRKGWDADDQSQRLVGALLEPGGGQFVLDPLLDFTGGLTAASLVNGGSNAKIELDYSDIFADTDANGAALQDVEVFSADGLDAVIDSSQAVKSQLVSFTADVTAEAIPSSRIYRFELNLPGDVDDISLKKQYADKSGFVDFGDVYDDPLVGEDDGVLREGLTLEDGKLVLYVQDNGVFDHDSSLGYIKDPFVVASSARKLENIVLPKPLARPESVGSEQKRADLSALFASGEAAIAEESSLPESQDQGAPTELTEDNASVAVPSGGSGGGGSSSGGGSGGGGSSSTPSPGSKPDAPSLSLDVPNDLANASSIDELVGRMAAFTASDIKELGAEFFADINAEDVSVLSEAAVAGFTPAQIRRLGKDAFRGFTGDQIENMKIKSFKALSASKLRKLGRDAVTGLTERHLKTLSSDELSQFKPKKLSLLNPESVRGLKARALNGLGKRQVRAFTCDQLAEFSSRQIDKAAGFTRKLSAKQERCLEVGSDRLSRSIDPWSELEPMIASGGESLF